MNIQQSYEETRHTTDLRRIYDEYAKILRGFYEHVTRFSKLGPRLPEDICRGSLLAEHHGIAVSSPRLSKGRSVYRGVTGSAYRRAEFTRQRYCACATYLLITVV